MKKVFFIIMIIFSAGNLSSQICNSPRFTELPVYSLSQIYGDTGIVYGQAINWLGADETLSLNICYPKLLVDTMQRRPLIMLIHGGGFMTGSKDDFNLEVYQFARRGFIAVTIDYRLGHDCGTDSLAYNKAVYRAMQDANAAMRFVVNMADSIRLDTNLIFIGGASAGSITALATIYVSQAEINATVPSLQSLLGNLNSSTNNLTNTFDIKGAFNNWGGIAAGSFEAAEAVPTISFHGDADSTVNIDSAYGGSCTNPSIIYGSNLIYQKMLEWGVCNQTNVKIGGGHGVYNTSSASSDFRVSKASCFFKSVMCGSCYSSYTTDSIPADCSITLSINDETVIEPYLMYPNPAQTVLNIKPAVANTLVDLYIYDLSGKIRQISFDKNEICVQNLSNGVYILQVRDGDIIQNYRFIKN